MSELVWQWLELAVAGLIILAIVIAMFLTKKYWRPSHRSPEERKTLFFSFASKTGLQFVERKATWTREHVAFAAGEYKGRLVCVGSTVVPRRRHSVESTFWTVELNTGSKLYLNISRRSGFFGLATMKGPVSSLDSKEISTGVSDLDKICLVFTDKEDTAKLLFHDPSFSNMVAKLFNEYARINGLILSGMSSLPVGWRRAATETTAEDEMRELQEDLEASETPKYGKYRLYLHTEIKGRQQPTEDETSNILGMLTQLAEKIEKAL